MQPGGECRFAAKRRDLAIELQKSFLREIFSLGLNPIGFLAAALFGLTPGLLFDYLQSETDAFRKGLKGSEASG